MIAEGAFDVKVLPLGEGDVAEGIALGRMTIDKTFHGDLSATTKGQMLTAVGEGNGSAAYVAAERVTGTLHGKAGSFVLLHRGIATREGQELDVVVARDSGTGALAGLAGTLRIDIVEKKHFYKLDYSLP